MKKLMISHLFALFFVAISSNLFAQGSQALYDLFPDLPEKVSNDDLRALIEDEDNRIPEEYYDAVGANSGYTSYYAPVGKITTKASTILFIAEIRKEPVADGAEILINVSKATFATKGGEMVVGGLEYYLVMSGEDALKREGTITYSGSTIEFWTKSTKLDDNSSEEETMVYSVGKKDIEFVEKK